VNHSRDRTFGLKIIVKKSNPGWKWLVLSGDELIATGHRRTQLTARAAAKSVKDNIVKGTKV